MKDDAVAPVIAVLLILAAIVTFFSIWNVVYIPSIKESAEVEHLRNVESAFLRFSSDIEQSVSARQDYLTLSEPVQLGGGASVFNSLTSGGSLSIEQEAEPVYHITVVNSTGPAVRNQNVTMVRIAYLPVGNFWQDQGYRWQYGYINVTKYNSIQSPLGYYSMTDVHDDLAGRGALASFARSLVRVEYLPNQSGIAGNCSALTVTAVNLSVMPDHSFASGNGMAFLKLKTSVNSSLLPNITGIAVGSVLHPFGNRTREQFNTSFSEAAHACRGNIHYAPEKSGENLHQFLLEQTVSPVTVTIRTVTIEVGAF